MRIAALVLPLLLAYPAAAETIRDRLGSTEIELNLSEDVPPGSAFARFMREDAGAVAADYAAEGAKSLRLTDEAAFVDARYASVLRRTEADLGKGAPNVYVEALTWDVGAEDFLRLDAVFDAGEPRDEALVAISHYIRQAIKTQVWSGEIDGAYQPLVNQATNPDPAILANFTIGRSADALVFHYSPYEIAPYTKGAQAIRVPSSVFQSWLNAKGKALFR